MSNVKFPMINQCQISNKKLLKYFFSALIAAGIFLYFSSVNLSDEENIQEASSEINNTAIEPRELDQKNITDESRLTGDPPERREKNPAEDEIPSKIFISVPFTSQAPFGKWDEYHEEACEEASLAMLEYYLTGQKLTPEIAEKEIQNLIKFQIKNYGDYKDTNVKETIKLAQDFYGIKNLKVIYDFSVEDLKKYLTKEKPIIIPAAGRKLGNPYFTQPGPLYHNLVLVGYDGDIIITNDPGTKRGEGYKYNINALYNAIHDFSGYLEDIERGRKAMIVVE